MKKIETKPTDKAETKKIKQTIQSGLIVELKKQTVKFGEISENLLQEIEKGSKKLAKKIAKMVKPAEVADKPKTKVAVVKQEKSKPVPKAKPAPAIEKPKGDQ